jgi:oligopeptide/dipeptide ABC transporter ATP-binding protein
MYEGEIVEEASTKKLLTSPLHPYTKLLLDSMPGFTNRNKRRKRIDNIRIKEKKLVAGCPFLLRCSEAQSICKKSRPILKESGKNRFVACHFN